MSRLGKAQRDAIINNFRERFTENAACHELLKLVEILDPYLTDEQRSTVGTKLLDYLAAENFQDAEKLLQRLNFDQVIIDKIINEVREYQTVLQHIVSSL